MEAVAKLSTELEKPPAFNRWDMAVAGIFTQIAPGAARARIIGVACFAVDS